MVNDSTNLNDRLYPWTQGKFNGIGKTLSYWFLKIVLIDFQALSLFLKNAGDLMYGNRLGKDNDNKAIR